MTVYIQIVLYSTDKCTIWFIYKGDDAVMLLIVTGEYYLTAHYSRNGIVIQRRKFIYIKNKKVIKSKLISTDLPY